MGRMLLVSNRLPLTVEKKNSRFAVKESVGGVATGLSSIYRNDKGLWLGWCGLSHETVSSSEKIHLSSLLQRKYDCFPLYLGRKDIRAFYSGFCNRTIWPLFHYFPHLTEYDLTTWKSYQKVNRLFCETVLQIAEPDDTIWIHDYHLFLLPGLLRRHLPKAQIGFFLHIPFPSYELFRLLPWRGEILEGILGSDLIGFHTYGYLRHFISSIQRILGLEYSMGKITFGNRMLRVDAFPMGIDYQKYHTAPLDKNLFEELQPRSGEGKTKIILSVDRLDYTKGIPERLKAFDYFLDHYPRYHEKVILVMVAVPSRTSVPTYHNLKKEVDELVGYINGKHSTLGWTPIQYYYRSFDFNRLVTLYSLSDVALLTPLRDGMNLVAKEYIASKKDGKGVLIFSEMAGATSELGEALIVNPNNREEIAAKLKQALEMSVAEQKERFSLMQERISRYTIFTWAEDFIQRLSLCKSEQAQIKTRHVSDENRKKILDSYKRAGRRLIILDYDGTLVPFQKDPSQAKPGKEIFKTLNKLIRDNKNELVIVSGRDKETLDKWFGHLNINLSAEHGLWIKNRKDDWHMLEHIGNEWKEVIRPIMRLFVDRTPGSFIEEKSHSLVWHYRKADLGMGTLRARELKTELLHLTANLNLHVMTGNMVLEVKRSEINKGRAVYYWSSEGSWEFIFAVGDDFTDEYIFEELPGKAFKIKVGIGMTKADYFLRDQAEVLELLREMSEQN